MNYLLDTHVLIWYFEDSSDLSFKVAEIIDNEGNLKFISSVSLWEIVIKANLGKLPFLHKDPFDRLLISTAIAEKLTIITVDENVQNYDVSWVW